MTARIVLDPAGRVVIPKRLREELRLEAGDELDMETVGEQIVLRPVREVARLSKEQGVWVFRCGQPLTAAVTDGVVERTRRARERENLGASK